MSREFDDLARALASGMSRRTALKRFVVAAAGLAVGGLLPGRAGAARSGDVPCASSAPPTCQTFCAWLYGKGTPAYTNCTNEGRCRYGPCYWYGPQSPDCHHSVCPVGTVCVSLNMNSNSTGSGLGGGRNYYCQPY